MGMVFKVLDFRVSGLSTFRTFRVYIGFRVQGLGFRILAFSTVEKCLFRLLFCVVWCFCWGKPIVLTQPNYEGSTTNLLETLLVTCCIH